MIEKDFSPERVNGKDRVGNLRNRRKKVMNLEELKVVDADVAAAIEAELPHRADRIRELGQ